MADIIENPDAVYGFSPNPESARLGAFAEYDWTDPKFVAEAKEERRAYHDSMESMTDILYRMRDEGASIEEIPTIKHFDKQIMQRYVMIYQTDDLRFLFNV